MKLIQRLLLFVLFLTLLFILPDAVSAAPPTVVGTDIFIITVKTDNPGTSTDTQFTIPTSGAGFNYNVDCDGNGIVDATGVTGNHTCNYGIPGTYTIHISSNSGTNVFFPRIYFNGGGDAQKLIAVNQWGDSEWFSMEKAFAGCTNMNILASDAPDLSGVTTLASMFYEATVMNADISSWDISNVVSTQYMFGRAHAFNQDISVWDTSSVENISYMFFDAESFNQPIGSWDTSAVVFMSGMFQEADDFNQPIGSWDTGSVAQIGLMFYNASSFDQNLGGWDVSSLTGASNMFLNVALSTSNYDALLIGWDAQVLQSSVIFSGGSSHYCAGETARANMTSSDSWSITDAGKDCTLPTTALRSPGVDALVYGGRPTFKWYPVDDASVYDVEMYGLSDELLGAWTKGVGACDPGPYCIYRIPFDLEKNYGDYDWRVRARNTYSDLEGDWSVTRTFTYIQLERTWQISPVDGYITSDASPTLQWGDITGATKYLLQFRLPDDTFVRNVLVDDATFCDGSTCTWDVDPELAVGTYKWHVRAKNGRNFGRWTAYRTIEITP